MGILIATGAVVTLIGLGLLIWCITRVTRARKSGLPDEELRNVMQSTVAMNLAALFISALGLMMGVVGILLG